MFGSLLTLFLLPWLDTSRVRSAFFRPVYKWVFCSSSSTRCCWAMSARTGPRHEHPPRPDRHLLLFFHFYVLFPLIGWFERPLPLPTSISAAVLAKHQAHARRRAREGKH